MLEMMNGSQEFIDKMEAETRKGPVVVSTHSRQQERQPDGSKDDRKLQGRHVVKIRVNAENVGSPEGAVAEDGLQLSGRVTPSNQVEVLSDGRVRIKSNDNDVEAILKQPVVVGRTLKDEEKRGRGVEEEVVMKMDEEEEESRRRIKAREETTTSVSAGQHQVKQVKGAGTVRSFLISDTTSSQIKNKSGLLPEKRSSSNQSTSNSVRINVLSSSATAAGESMMYSRNEEDSSYYSYNQLAYLYSHSGQSSPASDSGTCSDFDANTPPPLPKKKSALSKKISTIHLNLGNDDVSKHHHIVKATSLTSSGEPESDDDISCDSLNSSELEHQVVSSSSSTSSDPSHHLHITDHLDDLEDVDDGVHDVLSRRRMVQQFGKQKSEPPPLPPKKGHQKKILETTASVDTSLTSVETSFTPTKAKPFKQIVNHPQVSRQVSVEERTYNERNSSKNCVTSPNSTLERSVSSPSSSIYDSFYKFHLNENSDVNSTDDCNSLSSTATMRSSVTVDGLDSFAGRKGYVQDGDVENATIRSSKGTIRGVKNRVRAGIATFLQMHTNKRWEEKEAGKVVVYTTTMGTVRETYLRCLKVRQIMRTNLVKFEERDAFMSREVQAEIKERMSSDLVALPQVFVEGQHLGDAEAVERLNESGELRKILQPYKSADACMTCQVCGGYRLLPCGVCNGSKKSVHRNHFTTELVALKCMNCDEVGLVRCYAC
ncbi:uncharacterized protein LOC111056942 [Nilaparvata lugens]|uniref:uncharacterized protein LOC111056942 n=1 Tax=Nilaparvata lugens TaxID=108931 RepID=UPI00193E1FE0|nr:uncharacterized protein LOC111056942 [Nilaparvata lugens]